MFPSIFSLIQGCCSHPPTTLWLNHDWYTTQNKNHYWVRICYLIAMCIGSFIGVGGFSFYPLLSRSSLHLSLWIIGHILLFCFYRQHRPAHSLERKDPFWSPAEANCPRPSTFWFNWNPGVHHHWDCRKGHPLILWGLSPVTGDIKGCFDLDHHSSPTSPTWELPSLFHWTSTLGCLIYIIIRLSTSSQTSKLNLSLSLVLRSGHCPN